MADLRDARLFLSYKTDTIDPKVSTGLSQSAHMIRRELEHRGYQVWMDKTGIHTGSNWPEEIRKGMRKSDIALLLLSDKSKDSAGQAEEVIQALALEVKILPVVIRGNFDADEVLQNKFRLPYMQWLDFRIGNDKDLEALIESINTTAQRMNLSTPNKVGKITVAPQNAKYATYKVEIDVPGKSPYLFPCNIHLATGNMLQMRNIDVFVNSENAYFQMGRIFDSSTISALLRYEGSYIDDDGYLLEDTIQQELNGIIVRDNTRIPALVGKVIVTSSGHPQSKLRKKNTAPRFIFHTVAVKVSGDGTAKKMEAAEGTDITRCTKSVLNMVAQVNNVKKGVVSPAKTGLDTTNNEGEDEFTRQKNMRDNDKYTNIKSIILPLFGSGHGKIKTEDVIDHVCIGIKEFIEDIYTREETDQLSLTDIYVCVYNRRDVPIMRQKMKGHFRETEEPKNPIT